MTILFFPEGSEVGSVDFLKLRKQGKKGTSLVNSSDSMTKHPKPSQSQQDGMFRSSFLCIHPRSPPILYRQNTTRIWYGPCNENLQSSNSTFLNLNYCSFQRWSITLHYATLNPELQEHLM